MAEWTTAVVEKRLRKAIGPRASLSGSHSEVGLIAQGIGTIGVGARDGARDAVLDEAVEALSWLRWLDPDDAGIVIARLEGAPWKLICWRFGISRPTAHRRYRYGLGIIAWRLGGHRERRVPSLRSMLTAQSTSPRFPGAGHAKVRDDRLRRPGGL